MVIVLLDRGKGRIVLAGALGLWTLFQFYPQYAALPWPIAGNYLFDFSAWQLLFFIGILIGYEQASLPVLSQRVTRTLLIATGVGTLALIAAFYIIDPPTATMPSGIAVGSPVFHEVRLWLQEYFFAKVSLRPGRLLASAVTFSFLFLVCSVYWPRAQRLFGWLLLPLGQQALYAYTAHVIVVAVVAIALKPLDLVYPGPQLLNMVIQMGSVLVIWFLVQRRVLAPTARTRPLWNALPAGLAVGLVVMLLVFPAPAHPALAAPPPADTATEERVPRRFGTPLAKAAAAGPVQASGGPTPTPTMPPSLAERRPAVAPEPITRLAEWTRGLVGTVEEQWFYSAELDAVMPYIVYLPPDYREHRRRYPVLYMLHGRGGHRDEWIHYGLLDIADQQIRTGLTLPMIIVLPQGDQWYWANHAGDDVRWGEYIDRDLVAEIDGRYRTIRSPSARAIGGLSMGAWGALHHAFLHPDIFGVVGAHSPALREPDDPSIDFLGVGQEMARKDPMQLAMTQRGLRRLRIWIDTATEDPWAERAEQLHNILASRGIEHIWQLYEGEHNYDYWREHTIDYLRFYSDALAQQ